MYSYNSSYEGILERQRDPLNIVNNPPFEDGSANRVDAMDLMEKVHGESTQNSGSGDSNHSNLSALENETDDFGRLLLQHQRDAQRLNNVVRGGKEQAFRKARSRPGVAERLEREERERYTNGQNYERINNRGSPASDDVEPPVTVPREWGRKARKQTDWLKKIVEPSENGDVQDLNGEEEAIYSRNTAYTSDLNRQDVTNKPVNSIERTPSSIRRHQNADTPSSLNHMNTTLKPTFDFDEQDFTSTSFLASTPAPTRYPRKIDELARQELEELEIKAVTTRTLDRIDSRSPNAVLRSRSNSKLRERASIDRLRSPLMSPEKSSSPSRIPVRRQHFVNNKENAPPNIYSKAHHGATQIPRIATDDGTVQAVNSEKIGVGIDRRPLHGRNDSMNLLKKLARVSSLSPSPARPKSEPVDMHNAEHVDHEDDDIVPVVDQHVDMDDVEAPNDMELVAQSQPKAEDGKVELRNGDGNPKDFVHWNAEQVVFVGNDRPASTKEPEDEAVEAAKPPDFDGEPLKITKSLEDELQIEAIVEGMAKAKPHFPKSALEAIVREAKAERDTRQFGESTIQSLEDIVHPDLDPTITFDFDTRNTDVEEEKLDDGGPFTQAEKDRRQEDLAIEAMNKHLRTARTSIKDANRGIRRVENRMETTEERPFTAFARNSAPSKTLIITKAEDVINQTYCPTCGCHQQSAWKALYLEFRSLFYTYDETSRPLNKYLPISIRIRPTRVGFFILLCWIWYIIEWTLCDIYCHPTYEPRLFGRSRDYPWDEGPIFPFVIPTLMVRPFKPLWNPAKQALVAYYHAYMGNPKDMWRSPYKRWMPDANGRPTHVSPAEFDAQWSSRFSRFRTTFAPQLARATQTLAATLARATHSFMDAVDQAEYMWNDELLI